MKPEHISTRSVLAYFWSVCTAIMLGYILVVFGKEKEILTLIIGLIGGTILGGIFAVYFGGVANKPHPPQDGATAAEITANITTTDKSSTDGKYTE